MNNRQANAIVKMLDAIRLEIRANTHAPSSAGVFNSWQNNVVSVQSEADRLAKAAHYDLANEEES